MIFFFKIENLLFIASNELRKPMKDTELICTFNEKNIAEYIQMYVHITSFTHKLLSVLKIYNICNINYRLAIELQSIYQITTSKISKAIHH